MRFISLSEYNIFMRLVDWVYRTVQNYVKIPNQLKHLQFISYTISLMLFLNLLLLINSNSCWMSLYWFPIKLYLQSHLPVLYMYRQNEPSPDWKMERRWQLLSPLEQSVACVCVCVGGGGGCKFKHHIPYIFRWDGSSLYLKIILSG